MKEQKTNVMRILEQKKIPYKAHEYPHGDGPVDGVTVAESLGQPPEKVFKVLMQLGRVCVGLSAICVYLVFRDTLPTALRLRSHVSKVGMRLGRIIAFLAALLFACAEPVWRAGQTFSPVSLFILMASAAGCLFFVFQTLNVRCYWVNF